MDLKKVVRRRIRAAAARLDADADVNAVVAANVAESGQTTTVSSTATDERPPPQRERPHG